MSENGCVRAWITSRNASQERKLLEVSVSQWGILPKATYQYIPWLSNCHPESKSTSKKNTRKWKNMKWVCCRCCCVWLGKGWKLKASDKGFRKISTWNSPWCRLVWASKDQKAVLSVVIRTVFNQVSLCQCTSPRGPSPCLAGKIFASAQA